MEVIVEAIALQGFPLSCQMHISSGLRTATYKVTIAVDGKDLLTTDFSGKGLPVNSKPKKSKDGGESKNNDNLGNIFTCKILDKSSVDVKVECKHGKLNKPHEISSTGIYNVGTKIKLDADTALNLSYKLNKNEKRSGTLMLKVTRVSTSAELTLFKHLSIPTKCLYTLSDLQGLGIVSQVLKGDDALSCPEWVNFLGSMGKLLKIAEPVKEVDPHAKIALSAAQVAFELFMKQKDRDERIVGLTEVMGSTYQMILDSNPLQKCRMLSQSINDLIALTRECSYFIAEYIKSSSFGQRAVIYAFSNADDVITQFEKKFLTLKESFFTGIMLSIGQITVQILDKLEGVDAKLNQIFGIVTFPVVGRSWSRLDGCVENLQEPLLSKIYSWGSSSSRDFPNIFLLTGDSKLGKTSISHTVAKYFYDRGRLGATVFFDAENQSSMNFISSIIRELSAYHPAIHATVMSGLMSSNVKFINDSLDTQLHFLVSQVFNRLTIIGPLLIIVDGLDRCVDCKNLPPLLLQFPSNIRVMVTFAPTSGDVMSAFPERTYLLHEMSMAEEDDILTASVYISRYITLLEISRPKMFTTYPSQRIAKELHAKSFGDSSLFQSSIEFISIANDEVAFKYLEQIITANFPKDTFDAKQVFQAALIFCLDMVPYPITLNLIKRQRREFVMPPLRFLELHSFEFASTGMIYHRFSALIYAYIESTLNVKCKSASHCHSVGVLQMVSAIIADENFSNIPKGFSGALSCILTCKCSYPPQAMKEEHKSLLEYLLKSHQADCIHKASPSRFRNAKYVPSNVSRAILRHHVTLQNFKLRICNASADSENNLVYLTPSLQHSGLSTSADKITLLKISLAIDFSGGNHVQVVAVIYRAVTEKGKDTLSKMQMKLEESKQARAIEPYNESTNAADVQVVKNPLNGNGSWFIKIMPRFSDFEALWYNCPISASKRLTQDLSEYDAIDGRGIGFVTSLLPGDRIAILAKSSGWYRFHIETQVTLLTDPKEKCPPAK